MKTVQDYMNDPRILNDPCMEGALEPIREIHAIRLKLQDEYAGLSVEEETKLRNKRAVEFLASIGADPQLVISPARANLNPASRLLSNPLPPGLENPGGIVLSFSLGKTNGYFSVIFLPSQAGET
ncbi:MAG: hypothetical protein LBQ55_04365 [Treponema sp.]|jgi:hypothetical protein|nr:hypothetical protein [Treponema sp.]